MELRELQQLEALKRLELLEKLYNLHPNVLREFKQYGTIYYSEHINNAFCGVLYWLTNKQEFVDVVKQVEQQYNIYVYHCILNHTESGDWLTMLYVSSNEFEWEFDKEDIKTGNIMAYVETLDGVNSEFGSVEIAGVNGGLDRIS